MFLLPHAEHFMRLCSVGTGRSLPSRAMSGAVSMTALCEHSLHQQNKPRRQSESVAGCIA
jgi:hypothetical protein